MVVVPLVFFSLLVGVASLGDFRALGRLGGRTILYFTMTTIMALVIGGGLANVMNPGSVLSADDRAALVARFNDRRHASRVFLLSSRAGGCGLNLVGANRLALVDADRILVLEAGEVVEQGTHAELLAVDGRYASLWAKQMSGDAEP